MIDAHSLAERYSREEILTSYLDTLRLTPETIGPAAWNNLFYTDDYLRENTTLYCSNCLFSGLGQAPSTYVQDFEGAGKQRALTVLSVMKSNKIISDQEYKDSAEAVKKNSHLSQVIHKASPCLSSLYCTSTKRAWPDCFTKKR